MSDFTCTPYISVRDCLLWQYMFCLEEWEKNVTCTDNTDGHNRRRITIKDKSNDYKEVEKAHLYTPVLLSYTEVIHLSKSTQVIVGEVFLLDYSLLYRVKVGGAMCSTFVLFSDVSIFSLTWVVHLFFDVHVAGVMWMTHVIILDVFDVSIDWAIYLSRFLIIVATLSINTRWTRRVFLATAYNLCKIKKKYLIFLVFKSVLF